MAERDDYYAGDLDGVPTVSAASMRCGVCLSGTSIGVDLVDRGGRTIAHGHLDIAAAEEFWRMYGEAIVEAKEIARKDQIHG